MYLLIFIFPIYCSGLGLFVLRPDLIYLRMDFGSGEVFGGTGSFSREVRGDASVCCRTLRGHTRKVCEKFHLIESSAKYIFLFLKYASLEDCCFSAGYRYIISFFDDFRLCI